MRKKRKSKKKTKKLNEYKGYTQLYEKKTMKKGRPFIGHHVKAKNLKEAKRKVDNANKRWTRVAGGGTHIAKTVKVKKA